MRDFILGRFRRAALYLATALAFGFAIYFLLFLSYRPHAVVGSAVDWPGSQPAIWPLLVAVPTLLAASVMSLGGWRSAYYLAIAASFLGLVAMLSQICAFAFFLFLPLLSTGGYFSVVLPLLLSVATFVSTVRDLRSKQSRPAPPDVVAPRSRQNYLSLGFVAVTCLTAVLAGAAEISLRGVVVESHEMHWQISRTTRCDAYIELRFTAAPGYAMATCSPDLGKYLANEGAELVEVDLRRNYEWGTWRYSLESVGEWNGPATLSGLTASCPTQFGDCPSTAGPPLRQPYSLH